MLVGVLDVDCGHEDLLGGERKEERNGLELAVGRDCRSSSAAPAYSSAVVVEPSKRTSPLVSLVLSTPRIHSILLSWPEQDAITVSSSLAMPCSDAPRELELGHHLTAILQRPMQPPVRRGTTDFGRDAFQRIKIAVLAIVRLWANNRRRSVQRAAVLRRLAAAL
jgi:hypothetical protein